MNWMQNAALINGQWTENTSGDNPSQLRPLPRLSVKNPATDKSIGTVPICGEKEVDTAIRAAQKSFAHWSEIPATRRSAVLNTMADILEEHIDPIAEIITLENGKPFSQAKGEVHYTASYFRWFAGQAVRCYGQSIPGNRKGQFLRVEYSPVGVCALITPWNFPLAMLGRKMAAALAAGCTVVAKPAELTPFSGLILGQVASMAGVPHGVVNLLNGDPEQIGKQFCTDKRIAKLSFTGSTRVGRLLMAQCAPTLKRLSMELGGNAPFLVFEDAKLDIAIDGAMASKFRNAGQVCIASNRFLVQSNTAEPFIQGLVERVEKLKVGSGMDSTTDIGPMINLAGAAKVKKLVDDALKKGAVIRFGESPTGDNRWVKPIVLDKITEDMAIWQTEIFGPVVAIKRFDNEAEAIALANDTPFGLAAYFFSQDADRCHRVTQALDYGMVGINTGSVSTAQAPFGGVKQSGFGREGGPDGLQDYLKTKYSAQHTR